MKRVQPAVKFAKIIGLAVFIPLVGAMAQAKTYTVVTEAGNFGSISSDRFTTMARQIMAVVGKKIGVDIKVEILPGEKEIFDALKKGDAIMAIGVDYARAVDAGVPIVPWAALAINGKAGFQDCLWVAKSSSYKTVADLKGKPFIFRPTVSARKILLDAGFDMPISKFFSKISLYLDPVDSLEGIIKGDYAAVLMGTDFMSFLMFDEKFKKNIRQLACTETLMPFQFFRRKDLDPEMLEKLNLLAQNAHHDPDFKSVQFVFVALNAKMMLVDHDDYKPNLALFKMAKERGWVAEMKPYTDELAKMAKEQKKK